MGEIQDTPQLVDQIQGNNSSLIETIPQPTPEPKKLLEAHAARQTNIDMIRSRSSQNSEQNLLHAKSALQEVATTIYPEEIFEVKAKAFQDYYENNLFAQVVHKTREPLGN